MYEPMIFNPLAEHLIYRSLKNFNLIGHEVYWLLRSFLYMRLPYVRFAAMMEVLSMLSGSWRQK
jgi:phosphatidylinositol-4,5-bisphosphate 3-kinase